MSSRKIKVGRTGAAGLDFAPPFQGHYGKIKVVICPLCKRELFPMSRYFANSHARQHLKNGDITEAEKVSLQKQLLGIEE